MDVGLKEWRVLFCMFCGICTSLLIWTGLARQAGPVRFIDNSLYTSKNTWNTLLPIQCMRRRLSQIPTDVLRTTDGLVGRGCGNSNSAVTGSGTQAWGGNGQITGVAGSINMGDRDGANRANKAGNGTWGTGTQAEGKGRGSCCSAGNFSGHGQTGGRRRSARAGHGAQAAVSAGQRAGTVGLWQKSREPAAAA